MRKLFLFIPLLFLLHACTQSESRETLIVGKWQYWSMQTSATAFDSARVDRLSLQMKEVSYEFGADKSFTFRLGGRPGHGGHGASSVQRQEGRYALSEDGKSVTLTKVDHNVDQASRTMNIDKLTNDSLVLEQDGVRLIFLREK
jgi:hypothetical protein